MTPQITTTILLTRGYHALVSIEDYDRVASLKWRVKIDEDGRAYAIAHRPGSGKRGKQLLMHRFVLGYGANDPRIDHHDGDGLNNARPNLRPASNSENIRNSKIYSRKTTAKLKGVYFDKSRDRFRAQIMCAGKKINLGEFASENAAGRAYDEAARKLFGEFARLNTPEVTQ